MTGLGQLNCNDHICQPEPFINYILSLFKWIMKTLFLKSVDYEDVVVLKKVFRLVGLLEKP
jgi:hypothetical protein